MSAATATALTKFNVKVFATPAFGGTAEAASARGAVDFRAFIPVFHRFIQDRKLGGMLVDVAEYTHVAEGPQVLLVAHEGQWVLDNTGGAVGLVYSQRHAPAEAAGSPEAALTRALKEALTGCAVLEAEPEARAAGLTFQANRLELVVNDRGAAPNVAASYDQVEPVIKAVLGKAFPGGTLTLKRETEPRRRCGVMVEAPAASLADALKRLG